MTRLSFQLLLFFLKRFHHKCLNIWFNEKKKKNGKLTNLSLEVQLSVLHCCTMEVVQLYKSFDVVYVSLTLQQIFWMIDLVKLFFAVWIWVIFVILKCFKNVSWCKYLSIKKITGRWRSWTVWNCNG
jgi:hypothetical protein